MYLSLKKDCFSKPTLLCQIEDHSRVKFTGDAGAVGRLTTSEGNDKITIDLKGAKKRALVKDFWFMLLQDNNTKEIYFLVPP